MIGNVLARQFQLQVPDAALIDLDQDFISTIRDPQLIDVLAEKDDRLKFGSVLLDGYVRFDASASLSDVRRMIEIDTLFAFDNLIRNPDRNLAKPNLLVKSNQAYLIDHELGFEITHDSASEVAGWQWKERFFRYHIFYDYLKGTGHSQKMDYFAEFYEYLKYLDINILRPFFDQLADSGFSAAKHDVILGYLADMKQNSGNFVNLLKGLIS